MQCKHCSRQYKIKIYYDRHILACGLLHKTSKERHDSEEIHQDTPDTRTLYDMVLELSMQVQKLQNKVQALENASKRTQKKINILDWLNNQPKPACDWEHWVSSMQFDRSNLIECFNTNITTSVIECMKQYCDNINILPVRAFNQKPNILYTYGSSGWAELRGKEFERIVCRIHKLCMQEFSA